MKPLESWAGKNNTSIYSLENTFHEDTCPVCGKRFIRMCRRNEWGYWYNDSQSGHTARLILLCSGECSKKYAEMRFMRDVKKVAQTKTYQAYRMVMTLGLSVAEAAKRVGITSYDSTMRLMQMNHWRELEWLEAHGWEAPE